MPADDDANEKISRAQKPGLFTASAAHGIFHSVGELPYTPLDGQWCGLFAVDIVGFNNQQRDDDIQAYLHKSLYEMLQAAFDRSGLPWANCICEDLGDGALVIIPPTLSPTGLVGVPERLQGLVRRHNHVSCQAAHVQLRTAMHVGPVHYDGHGFVGRDINILFRLLDARSLRKIVSDSGIEVGLMTSAGIYDHVIRRRPAIVDLSQFQHVVIRSKEERIHAWMYAPELRAQRATA